MADEKRNQLMVAAGNEPLLGAGIEDVAPAKSSSFAFLGNVDVMRQVTLILGLAICLDIAHSMQADIELLNRLSDGGKVSASRLTIFNSNFFVPASNMAKVA